MNDIKFFFSYGPLNIFHFVWFIVRLALQFEHDMIPDLKRYKQYVSIPTYIKLHIISVHPFYQVKTYFRGVYSKYM